MTKINPFVAFFIIALLFLPGCDLIAGIFKAGFWTAILLVVLVVALVGWGIYSLSKNGNGREDV